MWGVILGYLHIYDTILLRAASTWLFELCKEIRPFPKYFVLDQDKYVEYLVESGSISGLEYVKKTLRFEWPPNLCCVAARSGQVDMLKHLRKQGLQFDINTILMDCARCTCDIAMVKYLHENGVPWMQYDISNLSPPQTVIDLMAYTGHIECMKYALENGCVDYHVNYVPSVECWEFAKEWTHFSREATTGLGNSHWQSYMRTSSYFGQLNDSEARASERSRSRQQRRIRSQARASVMPRICLGALYRQKYGT